MGIVYKAYDEKLQRTVALKVLPASLSGNDDRKARFLREARSAAAATHANIAALYEVGEHKERVFLVMELVEGKTLGRILKDGPLTVTESLRIAKGIARGLARAHERGIVHRDLKPENVMLDADGEVKLLDFGLAKLREQQDTEAVSRSMLEKEETAAPATQEGRVLGTPGYMSPEQAKGKAVDHRTDVFSFGLVLYEMLTGQKAFKGETPLDVMIALTRDHPPPASKLNPAVSPEVERIVAKCLAKAPEDRYATTRDLLAAIEATVSSSASGPAAVTATTTSSATGTPLKRGGLPAVIAGIAAVLALGAAAVLLRARGADPSSRVPAKASAVPIAPTATAITDLPTPKTTNPVATSEYAAALQSYRDGSVAMGNAHIQRAVDLDPNFAAGHLMLAVGGTGLLEDLRKHVAMALEHRADLTPRDLAVLEAVQADVAHDTLDFDDQWKRWSRLADRFPGDAAIAVFAAQRGIESTHVSEALALADRAVAVDPKFTWPLMVKAIALNNAGRYDEALATVDRCLSITPAAPSCLRRRAEVEQRRGQCKELLADARSMVAIEPYGSSAYDWMTTALLSTGAPNDSVEEANDKSRDLQFEPTMKMLMQGISPMLHPWLSGDLAGVEKVFAQWEAPLRAGSSDTLVGGLTGFEALVYEQAGDVAKSLAAYEGYLNRSAGLVADDPYGARPDALWARRRAKRVTEAAFQAQRDEWIKDSVSRLPMRDTGSVWFAYYAGPARTPDDAKEALDALPRFSAHMAPYEGTFGDWAMGHVLALAGRSEEAEPHLRRAAAACAGYFDLYNHLHAESDLGQVLEAKHDTAGACAAYGAVLARWGGTRQRVQIVDDARAHVAKLGCK